MILRSTERSIAAIIVSIGSISDCLRGIIGSFLALLQKRRSILRKLQGSGNYSRRHSRDSSGTRFVPRGDLAGSVPWRFRAAPEDLGPCRKVSTSRAVSSRGSGSHRSRSPWWGFAAGLAPRGRARGLGGTLFQTRTALRGEPGDLVFCGGMQSHCVASALAFLAKSMGQKPPVASSRAPMPSAKTLASGRTISTVSPVASSL